MTKIKYLGESGFELTKGNTYQLIYIGYDEYRSIRTLISNDKQKTQRMDYMDLGTFNENWEVVE